MVGVRRDVRDAERGGVPVTTSRLRLGVNIDHVATIRNARGGDHPDPVRAAEIVAAGGLRVDLAAEIGRRARAAD